MELEQLINSGILEIYCMGAASEEEKAMVESLAASHEQVRDEIDSINEALVAYATASEKSTKRGLKEKILDAIFSQQLPPLLTERQSIEWWINYLDALKINVPSDYRIFLFDLPSDEKKISYAAWAKKGERVEESHSDEDEYLFMIKGSCTVTLDGETTKYHPGDLIYIPKGKTHLAIVISDEPMLVIGQRLAA